MRRPHSVLRTTRRLPCARVLRARLQRGFQALCTQRWLLASVVRLASPRPSLRLCSSISVAAPQLWCVWAGDAHLGAGERAAASQDVLLVPPTLPLPLFPTTYAGPISQPQRRRHRVATAAATGRLGQPLRLLRPPWRQVRQVRRLRYVLPDSPPECHGRRRACGRG